MSKPGNIPVTKRGVKLHLEGQHLEPSGKQELDLLQVVVGSFDQPVMVMKPVLNKRKAIIDLVIHLSNAKAVQLFSQRNKALRGKRFLKVFPAAKEDGTFEAYVNVFVSGQKSEKESSIHINGEARSFRQVIRKYESGIVVTFDEVPGKKGKLENAASWKEIKEFIKRLSTTLPDLVYVYDINSARNVYSNRSVLDMLGYVDPSAELQNDIYGSLAHPGDLTRLEDVTKRIIDAPDGELVQNEFRMLHADGDYRWLVSRSAVFKRDSNGSVIQIIGVMQDITDRRNMEEAIREKNEQLLDAQTLTQMGNWIFNVTKGISHWSDQVYRLFGAQRVPGESTFDILDRHVFPEDLVKIRELAANAIENGASYQSYYRITRADGEMRVISTKAKVDRDKEGDLVLKGICQDITEKWMADERLLRSEALLQEAQRMAKLGSWEWDVRSNDMTWTDELYRMYGYETGEIKVSYDTYLQHIHPDDRHVIEVSIRSTLVTQFPFHNEYRIIRPNRDERIISSTGRVILDESGKVQKLFGICLDITDRREAEQEIRRKTIDIEAERLLNKKKDEFISIASHELKTPLTSLKAYIQLLDKLNRQQKGKEKTTSFLSKADLYVRRLENLVSDLLDVSKIEAGKLQFTMEELDLYEMLNESIENMSVTLTRHKLVVSNEAKVRVKGDRQRLDQVISNLISNAVKYSPKSDRIEICASADEYKVTITVKDFGLGIEASHLSRIFDRFYRAESISHNITGLGLGLYISSEVVKRHDGCIWAESELGKGSTFYFTLPVLR